MNRLRRIFIGVFIVSVLVQLGIWHADAFTDGSIWIRRVGDFAPIHELAPQDLTEKRYSSTPGTTILLLASGLHAMHIPADLSLRIAVSILVSVAVAGTASVIASILPNQPVWIATSSVLAAHSLYLQASPVDAVASAMIVLCCVMIAQHARPEIQITRRSEILLALCIGTALATRLHVAVLILGILGLFFWRWQGRTSALLVAGLSAVWAVALNPFLLFVPSAYFQVGILGQLGFFTGSNIEKTALSFLQVSDILYVPFAVLSLILALIFLIPHMPKSTLPRRALIALMVTTGAVIVLLLLAALQSLRYFFPLIFLWEALLPVFLIPLASHFTFRWVTPEMQQRYRIVAGRCMLILITIINPFLTLYSIVLPTRKYLVEWDQISMLFISTFFV